MSRSVYVIATMDTKGHELAFVAELIRDVGVDAVLVDVGTGDPPSEQPGIPRETVAACHPRGAAHVLDQSDRGTAVTAMSEALTAFLAREHSAGNVAGAIGLGGTGGTALIAPSLSTLPVGLPKLIVSTVASGNTAAYVGCGDLILMPSVVDVAGLNVVSRKVLANAAHAIAGMVSHQVAEGRVRPAVGMTMFGVTTPCVTAAREKLEADGSDVLVFHATGTGGQAMEKLVDSGLIGGVIDATTTEVADEVVGGVFRAGPDRFDAILRKRVPYVLSVGALDMVNFGARDTVPAEFRSRTLHVHNANVTLMRTTPDENRLAARWIAEKLNRSTAPLILLIPDGGVSALDAPGMPFWDREADAALFDELEHALEASPQRQIRRLPHHINAPAFAQALVDAYHEVSA
ncbi:MAG: Tm-1-like ATP-binding domain-containing protein [Planctomycetaceae bacterium]